MKNTEEFLSNVMNNVFTNIENVENEQTSMVEQTKKQTTMVEQKTSENTLTLGLGFHKFDGQTPIAEVIKQIGADFEVQNQQLIRLPNNIVEKIMLGESVNIDPKYLIHTHKANVTAQDDFIAVVGESYGIIQNNTCFELLDMLTNTKINNDPIQVVSAGLVDTYEPYIQCKLPYEGRIIGDNSPTEFYIFAHTSHDGTSGLQIRFSPVRVVCQNTFMANVSSKLGLTFKHSRNVSTRVDFSKSENIKYVQQKLRQLNILCDDYINKMNSYAIAKVSDSQIIDFVNKLFITDKDLLAKVQKANNNPLLVDEVSTRTKNNIVAFNNIIGSDNLGQDIARGSKLWLFNATTNYLSNSKSYGNQKDDFATRQTKRFKSMLSGGANKDFERAEQLLLAM